MGEAAFWAQKGGIGGVKAAKKHKICIFNIENSIIFENLVIKLREIPD